MTRGGGLDMDMNMGECIFLSNFYKRSTFNAYTT